MLGGAPGPSRGPRCSNIPDKSAPAGSPPQGEQGSPSPDDMCRPCAARTARSPARRESASEDGFICVFPEGRDGWLWLWF